MNELTEVFAQDIIQHQLEQALGLPTYRKIMDNVNPSNEDFRKMFDGFYKIRRDEEWRLCYYRIFEEMLNDRANASFENIIRAIQDATKCCEASFASKMLATINPNKPILDSNVLKFLGLHLADSGTELTNRVDNAIRIYTLIEKRYAEILSSLEGQKCIVLFNKTFPDYSDISDVKKIDCFLWGSADVSQKSKERKVKKTTIRELERDYPQLISFFNKDEKNNNDEVFLEEGLKPVIDENSRILVLGTFPGEESLASQKYYNDNSNKFWKVVSDDEEDIPIVYENRLKLLSVKGIALWDIYHMVVRKGSADKDIKAGCFNNIFEMLQKYPKVKTVALCGITEDSKVHPNKFLEHFFKDVDFAKKCTGKNLERKQLKNPIDNQLLDFVFLPSTSGSNGQKNLRQIWQDELNRAIKKDNQF